MRGAGLYAPDLPVIDDDLDGTSDDDVEAIDEGDLTIKLPTETMAEVVEEERR